MLGLDKSMKRQTNVENLLVSGAFSASTRKTLLDQFKQMQANNTSLQISIRQTELEAAGLQTSCRRHIPIIHRKQNPVKRFSVIAFAGSGLSGIPESFGD
jgi:hypothetical protein